MAAISVRWYFARLQKLRSSGATLRRLQAVAPPSKRGIPWAFSRPLNMTANCRAVRSNCSSVSRANPAGASITPPRCVPREKKRAPNFSAATPSPILSRA